VEAYAKIPIPTIHANKIMSTSAATGCLDETDGGVEAGSGHEPESVPSENIDSEFVDEANVVGRDVG